MILVEISTIKFVKYTKAHVKQKKINLGAKMHYLGNFEKLLSYLNLASSDMLKYKVLYKTKEL